MLGLAAGVLGLLVWGAHGTVPSVLIDGDSPHERSWRRLAMPLTIGAIALWLAAQGAAPDAALGAGLGPGLPTGLAAIAALLVLGAVLGDFAVLLRSPRGRREWWTAAAIAALGPVGYALIGELLRLGAPAGLSIGLLVAAGSRLLIALGAGEAFVARRPRFAPFAAAALALYCALLPSNLANYLLHGTDALTIAAAVLLFATARWLPPGPRRIALLAAALLAALLLERVAALTPLATPLAPIPDAVE